MAVNSYGVLGPRSDALPRLKRCSHMALGAVANLLQPEDGFATVGSGIIGDRNSKETFMPNNPISIRAEGERAEIPSASLLKAWLYENRRERMVLQQLLKLARLINGHQEKSEEIPR